MNDQAENVGRLIILFGEMLLEAVLFQSVPWALLVMHVLHQGMFRAWWHMYIEIGLPPGVLEDNYWALKPVLH